MNNKDIRTVKFSSLFAIILSLATIVSSPALTESTFAQLEELIEPSPCDPAVTTCDTSVEPTPVEPIPPTCDPAVSVCETPVEPIPPCDPTVLVCPQPLPQDNSTSNNGTIPVKQFCDPSIETCDPNAKSKIWVIVPRFSVSFGEILGVQGVEFRLINGETGITQNMKFLGLGLAVGVPIEFGISNPSPTSFTSEIPLSFDDFDRSLGSLVSVDFTPGVGAAAACAMFRGLPTIPDCIDIGGLQVGFGLGASAIGGQFFIEEGSSVLPPPSPPSPPCDPAVESCPP